MSKVALSGNASGTGTFTIASPNSNTDRTLNLPDQTGTLLTGSGAIGVNASAATNSLVIDASGNVGIGTSSPNGKLDVKTASDSKLIFNDGSTAGNVRLEAVNNAYSAYKPLEFNGSVQLFATGGSERARIDSNGNLLVGTASFVYSSERISVLGNSVADAVAAWKTQRSVGQHIFLNSSGGLSGFIQWSGSTTAYNTSSDYRLKENIQPMTGALEKVAALKPCTYKWKADDSDGEGFIAHELAEVCPQAVTGEKDAVNEDGSIKPQGIDTSFLVATLTAAIQELKAIVDAQGAEIAALKGTA